MSYTKENFQEWIFLISNKMDYLTSVFAKEQGLVLDYSLKSLDQLERWLLLHFKISQKVKIDKFSVLTSQMMCPAQGGCITAQHIFGLLGEHKH